MTAIETTATDLEHSTAYQLVALDRPQLEAAQAKMIEWAKARRDQVDVDWDVENTSLDLAMQHGWLTAPFERRLSKLARQRTFYAKILQALEAGYAIVPNFQMNVFAVRTRWKAPRGSVRSGRYNRPETFAQGAELLEAGDGRYVNPIPDLVTDSYTEKDDKRQTVTKYQQWPGDEFNDVEFPIALAKPQLMTRVGEAMAIKLFDEIGVAVDTWDRSRSGAGRGDPILLGRLLNPRTNRPSVSFFLGWYFDPSKL